VGAVCAGRHDGWRELVREDREQLLELNGLVEIVVDRGASSAAALQACDLEWEELRPDDAARRFGLRIEPESYSIFQPEAGVVYSDRAQEAFLAGAIARGAEIRQDRPVGSLLELDSRVVVVTAGAWAPRLLAAVGIRLDARVTRETVAYFRLGTQTPPPAVVHLRSGSTHHGVYALRDPVHGLKVGCHLCGPETDPDDPGEPDAATVAELSLWVADHFPEADADPVAAECCLYTTTPDERFVLERHGRIVVGSACSGHGFKFAPAVGARLAGLALEALRGA
jgi:sarcosine oxidase